MTQRTTQQTLEWYRTHTTTKQIGFNPDGMCLKVVRTARNIPAKYQSAKEAQDATPLKHRITDISKIQDGMILYLDDPKDSNRFGHIVTVVGRKPGVPRHLLSSLIVKSNSVVKGQLVSVSASYFPEKWGDSFVFASDWLNGVVLDLPQEQPQAPVALQNAIKAGAAYRDALRAYRASAPVAVRAPITAVIVTVKKTITVLQGWKR